MEQIERGKILFLDEIYQLINNTVMININDRLIPIGNISLKDMKWFDDSEYPKVISKVVYLGDFEFGVKQLTSPIEEFNKLSKHNQDRIILDYINNNKT